MQKVDEESARGSLSTESSEMRERKLVGEAMEGTNLLGVAQNGFVG